jgi:hypothetical protein
MTDFIPHVYLYTSDGITLLYTFPLVQDDINYPHSKNRFTEINSFRGTGSFVVEGSEEPWDLSFTTILLDDNYSALITKIDALETAIVFNTPYILKIDKTISTSYSYRVKRLKEIEYPPDGNRRTTSQNVKITFRVNSW